MADNYLITGYWGEPHVTAENDRGINAGIVGAGRFVLPVGKQFKAEYIGNNTVRLYDGKLVDNGAAGGIPAGEYVDLFVANASQGMNRNDLIVFQYEQNVSTLTEKGTFVVIQGTETSGTAADPTLRQEDLLSGNATFDQMALWRVSVSTGTISTPVQLFDVSKSIAKAGTGKNIVANAISSDGVTYTATVEDLEELYNGLAITIIPNITSATTAPTLNVNGLGAKPIRLSLSQNNSLTCQPANDNYFAEKRPVQLMFDPNWLSTGMWRVTNKQRPSAVDLYGKTPVTNGGTGLDSVATGNFLVGNGEEPMEEKTPDEVLEVIGAVGYELLWENASPTSSFSTQTLSVTGMSAYKAILVVCTCGIYMLMNNGMYQSMDHGRVINDKNHQRYTRNVTPNGNTIEFHECRYSVTGTDATLDNNTLIPYKIYGVKGLQP